MNRGKEPLASLCERQFVLEALREGKRLDGRGPYDYRSLQIKPCPHQPGSVEVALGSTRVLANVTCEVVRPRPQRPTEGELFFNVELSPMASPAFEVGRSSPMATEIARMLERCLKESRAVDTEALCIIAGEKVWSVRVDIHVLDSCGNLIDCASVAAITALKHFRRPDVTVTGEEATIHPVTERDPVPLSVHHMPLCISFAFFSEGEGMLIDPGVTEEAVMEGRLVVGVNIHREICVLSMAGGVAILPDQLLKCTKVVASLKCEELTEAIQNALTTPTTTSKYDETHKKKSSILETKRGVEEVKLVMSEGVTREEVSKAEMAEEEDDDIVCLGEGTAEVGLGGRSQWRVESEKCESGDEDNTANDDVMIIGEEVRGEGVPMGRLSEEEEESVVILTETDIGGFTKQRPSAGGRGAGPSRRGKQGRGTRGQEAPPPPPPAVALQSGRERGRGRGSRRKKKRKQ